MKRERLDSDYERDFHRREHDRYSVKQERRDSGYRSISRDPYRHMAGPSSTLFGSANTSNRIEARYNVPSDITPNRFIADCKSAVQNVKTEQCSNAEIELAAIEALDRATLNRCGRSNDNDQLRKTKELCNDLRSIRESLEQKKQQQLVDKVCNDMQADGEYETCPPLVDESVATIPSIGMADIPNNFVDTQYQLFNGGDGPSSIMRPNLIEPPISFDSEPQTLPTVCVNTVRNNISPSQVWSAPLPNHAHNSNGFQAHNNRPGPSTSQQNRHDHNMPNRPTPPSTHRHPMRSLSNTSAENRLDERLEPNTIPFQHENNSPSTPSRPMPPPHRQSFDQIRSPTDAPSGPTPKKKMTYADHRRAKAQAKANANSSSSSESGAANTQSNVSRYSTPNPFRPLGGTSDAHAIPTTSTATAPSIEPLKSSNIDTAIRDRNWDKIPDKVAKFRIPKLNRPDNNSANAKSARSGASNEPRPGPSSGAVAERSSNPKESREPDNETNSILDRIKDLPVSKEKLKQIEALITGQSDTATSAKTPTNTNVVIAAKTPTNTDTASSTQQPSTSAAVAAVAATKKVSKKNKYKEIDRLNKDIGENMPDIFSIDKRSCTKNDRKSSKPKDKQSTSSNASDDDSIHSQGISIRYEIYTRSITANSFKILSHFSRQTSSSPRPYVRQR